MCIFIGYHNIIFSELPMQLISFRTIDCSSGIAFLNGDCFREGSLDIADLFVNRLLFCADLAITVNHFFLLKYHSSIKI